MYHDVDVLFTLCVVACYALSMYLMALIHDWRNDK